MIVHVPNPQPHPHPHVSLVKPASATESQIQESTFHWILWNLIYPVDTPLCVRARTRVCVPYFAVNVRPSSPIKQKSFRVECVPPASVATAKCHNWGCTFWRCTFQAYPSYWKQFVARYTCTPSPEGTWGHLYPHPRKDLRMGTHILPREQTHDSENTTFVQELQLWVQSNLIDEFIKFFSENTIELTPLWREILGPAMPEWHARTCWTSLILKLFYIWQFEDGLDVLKGSIKTKNTFLHK